MTKTRRMLKKSEKGETSSSEQAAVVSIELVRYTRVMSGTSMYQSCSVVMPTPASPEHTHLRNFCVVGPFSPLPPSVLPNARQGTPVRSFAAAAGIL